MLPKQRYRRALVVAFCAGECLFAYRSAGAAVRSGCDDETAAAPRRALGTCSRFSASRSFLHCATLVLKHRNRMQVLTGLEFAHKSFIYYNLAEAMWDMYQKIGDLRAGNGGRGYLDASPAYPTEYPDRF